MIRRVIALVVTLAALALMVPTAQAQGSYGPFRSIPGAEADALGKPGTSELGDVDVWVRDTATNGTCAGAYVQGKRANGTLTATHYVGQACTGSWVKYTWDFADNVETFRLQVCNLGINCSAWSGFWETNFT